MMASLLKLAVSLTYPPTLSLCLTLLAIPVLLRRRRAGVALMLVAVGWSALWSIPLASDWLRGRLEERYPVVEEETRLPQADAIVVLGGGSHYGWLRRSNVSAADLESSRLAAGARAWLAGRAPRIILSGGGDGGSSEARMMARAIARLGVPPAALMLEERSRNTRDNARYTAALAQQHRMRRVLLVTSSLHMPRAIAEFRAAGIDAVAVSVPEHAARSNWRERWLPSYSALWRSGRAFKEYGGLLMMRLQG